MSIKKAMVINAIGKYSVIVLQLVVTAILARLLSAEDYGVVAIITVFSTFFSTLSDMGFGVAIVQRKDLSERDIGNIFSITICVSVILAIVFCILSIPISIFYQSYVYIPLGMILSISLLFNTVNMIPNGILNRDKKFKLIAIRNIGVYLLSAIIAVLLAKNGFRFYSLAIQTTMSAVLSFLISYFVTKPIYISKIDFKILNKIGEYSGFQFAFNVLNYFSRNLDNLLTGKFFGIKELGYYNKAYTLMLYPVNNLAGVLSPILHPVLADFQEDTSYVYKQYVKIFKALSIVGLYVAPICYLCSEEIILILFGNQWGNSASCFAILSIAIIPQMINSCAGAFFQILGNTRLLFVDGVINTVITITAILIGVFFGGNIVSLSIAVTAAYIFHFFTAEWFVLYKLFKTSFKVFLVEIKKEIIILLIGIALCCLCPLQFDNIFLSLAAKILYFSTGFILILFLTKEYKIVSSLFHKRQFKN